MKIEFKKTYDLHRDYSQFLISVTDANLLDYHQIREMFHYDFNRKTLLYHLLIHYERRVHIKVKNNVINVESNSFDMNIFLIKKCWPENPCYNEIIYDIESLMKRQIGKYEKIQN